MVLCGMLKFQLLDVNDSTYMDENIGNGHLKLSKNIWTMLLEKVLDRFGMDDPPVRKKLLVEVDIPEEICTKDTVKEVIEHYQAIGDWELITFYFLLRIG